MTKSINILIVEDNHDLIEIMSQLIQSYFSKVVQIYNAEDIKSAQLILENKTIDLIICDHYLSSNETGACLLEFLKNKELKTKFVLCSSYTPDQFPNSYPSGSCYFNIQKPEVNEGLEKLIEKLERSNSDLSLEINYDYNERSVSKLSDQLNQIISADDVPLDRKIISSYLHAIQELKDQSLIPESFVFNKNLVHAIINDLCKIKFFYELYTHDHNCFLFPIYQSIFISLITRRIDADVLTVEGKLYQLSFLYNSPEEVISQIKFINFNYNASFSEISDIVTGLSLKPKSQTTAIFYISFKLTAHFFDNNSQLNYLEFKNKFTNELQMSSFYAEIIKILDFYFVA